MHSNENDFEIVLNQIEQHHPDSHWQKTLLSLIPQQTPQNITKAIRRVLDRNSPYEQWLHRDLLFAARCLGSIPKPLQGVDSALVSEILDRLMELELSDQERIGLKLREQVFQVFCSLGGSAFEAETLQRLKDKADRIDEQRLRWYQIKLGDEDGAIAPLLAQLKTKTVDQEFINRDRVAEALVELGKASNRVVQELLVLLQEGNSTIRASIVWALVALDYASDQQEPGLWQRLNDADADVRARAAAELGYWFNAEDQLRQALVERLNDQDDLVRQGAVQAVSSWINTHDEVVQGLLTLLNNVDPFLGSFSKAIATLPELNNPSDALVHRLLEFLDAPNFYVRWCATDALVRWGINSEEVMQTLFDQLHDEDSYSCYDAAHSLVELGIDSDEVVQVLVKLIHDEMFEPSRAAYTLVKLGKTSDKAVQVLVELLNDQDEFVREVVARELGSLENASKQVVFGLLARLDDQNNLVRGNATASLGCLGNASDKVIQSLFLTLLNDEDEFVCFYAADALLNWDNASTPAVQALLGLLKAENPGMRSWAAEALGKLENPSDEVVQDLLAGFKDDYSGQRYSAAYVLGKLGKTCDRIEPALVQWMEQHQNSEYLGHGSDALWEHN